MEPKFLETFDGLIEKYCEEVDFGYEQYYNFMYFLTIYIFCCYNKQCK